MGQATQAVAYARAQIGKPYKWATAGPNTFDCSGLVVASYKSAGLSLPHYTGALILLGTPVAKEDLIVGDLVFPEVGHVQLYSGDGNIVEAPRSGENVTERPMWGFMTARRIVSDPDASPTGKTGSFGIAPAAFGIPNPLDLSKQIGDQVLRLASPDFWKRIGQFALGASLVMYGLLFMTKKLVPVASQVGMTLAESYVGGKAFGAGTVPKTKNPLMATPASPVSSPVPPTTVPTPPALRIPKAPPAVKRGVVTPMTVPIVPKKPGRIFLTPAAAERHSVGQLPLLKPLSAARFGEKSPLKRPPESPTKKKRI